MRAAPRSVGIARIQQRSLLNNLNAPAKFRIGAKAHDVGMDRCVRSPANGDIMSGCEQLSCLRDWSTRNSLRGRAMARRRLAPSEIVERLQIIEALTAEGLPLGQAIRSAGVLQVDYDRWLPEYDGLLRTLSPLSGAFPKFLK